MLKVRIYYSNLEEATELVEEISKSYNILKKSGEYKDRNSNFYRQYLDVEKK